MITLDLPFHNKARVWIGDLPQSFYSVDRIIERVIDLDKPSLKSTHRAAIEMIVPRGARNIYGLLGAEMLPNKLNCIGVQIFTSNQEGEPLVESLAHSLDDPRVGLPNEYAYSIIDGVLAAKEEDKVFSSGEIKFNCAAYSPISSCEFIFKHLSQAVTKILSLGNIPLTEEYLIEVTRI